MAEFTEKMLHNPVFLGQMVLSVIIDTMGWGNFDPIPLDSRRIIGLIIMGISVALLLPRK